MMALHPEEGYKTFYDRESDFVRCKYAGLPLLTSAGSLMIPVRSTHTATTEAGQSATLENQYPTQKAEQQVKKIKEKGAEMAKEMKKATESRFPQSNLDQLNEKEKEAALFPVLLKAREASNEEGFTKTEEVKVLVSKNHMEGISNLCLNIYRNRDFLVDCKSDIDLYHFTFTRPELYRGGEHVLDSIAKIFCSCPPESIEESMGSTIERIRAFCRGSLCSTNKNDIRDLSDELIIHWNGPLLNKCNNVVKQTLNLHFKGGLWHFSSRDVRA
ncbi:hypothetical protein HOLleu_04890 [Holothuria leucospilota]|uniref:Uncharacterized protein n=1 Tax=Holothuria leucospilota TaxID=206669 RepID=A0A9Q1CJ53_HOLLE|nr:hypothetical protein HOLleu_04890 [Holothuria leucospilota]